jgi:hypothetical protein
VKIPAQSVRMANKFITQATKISRTLRRSRCTRLPGWYLIPRCLERRRMKNLLTKPKKEESLT